MKAAKANLTAMRSGCWSAASSTSGRPEPESIRLLLEQLRTRARRRSEARSSIQSVQKALPPRCDGGGGGDDDDDREFFTACGRSTVKSATTRSCCGRSGMAAEGVPAKDEAVDREAIGHRVRLRSKRRGRADCARRCGRRPPSRKVKACPRYRGGGHLASRPRHVGRRLTGCVIAKVEVSGGFEDVKVDHVEVGEGGGGR